MNLTLTLTLTWPGLIPHWREGGAKSEENFQIWPLKACRCCSKHPQIQSIENCSSNASLSQILPSERAYLCWANRTGCRWVQSPNLQPCQSHCRLWRAGRRGESTSLSKWGALLVGLGLGRGVGAPERLLSNILVFSLKPDSVAWQPLFLGKSKSIFFLTGRSRRGGPAHR